MHTPLYAKLLVSRKSLTGEYEDLFLSYVAPYFVYLTAYEIIHFYILIKSLIDYLYGLTVSQDETSLFPTHVHAHELIHIRTCTHTSTHTHELMYASMCIYTCSHTCMYTGLPSVLTSVLKNFVYFFSNFFFCHLQVNLDFVLNGCQPSHFIFSNVYFLLFTFL